jgi:hypothetical protein
LDAINNAYAKRIKTLSREHTEQVNKLMKNAGKLSPRALLKRLKKICGS